MSYRKVRSGLKIRKSRGGRTYIHCRDDTETTFARAVLEAKLGRELRGDEQAHHINGDCSDDRPENLMVVGAAEHQHLHGHSWRSSRWSDRTCVGCGCDHDQKTTGCKQCHMRFRSRKWRERHAA